MTDDLQYSFPEDTDADLLWAVIADDYALKAEEQVETATVFYDTFDWRLFKKSLVLSRTGDEWIVRGLPSGDELERLTSVSTPGFATDIADSALKQRIESTVGVRRLLAVGEATFQTAPYRVLNDNDKTVAWLSITRVWAGPAPEGAPTLDFSVGLRAVRGYTGNLRRLAEKCEEAGLTPSQWQETFERIVTIDGRQPGQYSAKPDYQLYPGMRADTATKRILRLTLEVMRANEEGIKTDADMEFLHDYRTAVRRTRSALSQIPDVFPLETTACYKEAFALLGEQTNQLRDLDVYLLSEPEYRAMFPEAMRDYISPVFDFLRPQRAQALRKVIDHLDSESYAATMAAWSAFLHEPVSHEPAVLNAALPIIELARKRVSKQYRRVIKDGKKILESDEDEPIHQLRIDCKKLRYLIEFFASLFPAKEIGMLTGQLKKLQDQLGDFNDLSVQQAYLLHIAEVLPASDAEGKKGLVAIGFLVEKLAGEQQAMKPGLAQAFSEFAAAPNRALFRQLFSTRGRESDS